MKRIGLTSGLVGFCLCLAVCPTQAASDSVITAVYSNVKNDYTRTKLPDGTFQKEYYALARGHYSPGVAKDRSIDEVEFPKVAGVIATYLAKQGYYLAPDSKSADLLLVVTWGTTVPFNSGVIGLAIDQLADAMHGDGPNSTTGPVNGWLTRAVMSGQNGTGGNPDRISGGGSGPGSEEALLNMQSVNAMRLRADETNARLLGYNREIVARDNISRYAGNGDAYDRLISDIEEERYYVIVSAYDFKAAKNEKKEKPLWSTRVSIRVRQNRFDERLPEMIAKASRYFGADSPGLVREDSNGTTTLKDLTILGTVPEAELSNSSPQPRDKKAK